MSAAHRQKRCCGNNRRANDTAAPVGIAVIVLTTLFMASYALGRRWSRWPHVDLSLVAALVILCASAAIGIPSMGRHGLKALLPGTITFFVPTYSMFVLSRFLRGIHVLNGATRLTIALLAALTLAFATIFLIVMLSCSILRECM